MLLRERQRERGEKEKQRERNISVREKCIRSDWGSNPPPFRVAQSGHMPGLQARSPVGGTKEATTH